jgi:hypothetical protein
MIEYHNPDAQVAVDEMPYDLSVAIAGEESTRIGLLANGFPDSVSFLDEVGNALRKLHPGIKVTAYNKGNASMPAGEQLLGEIGGECIGVIAAYGH